MPNSLCLFVSIISLVVFCNLGKVTLCRRHPLRPSSTLPSSHQRRVPSVGSVALVGLTIVGMLIGRASPWPLAAMSCLVQCLLALLIRRASPGAAGLGSQEGQVWCWLTNGWGQCHAWLPHILGILGLGGACWWGGKPSALIRQREDSKIMLVSTSVFVIE